VPVDPDAATGDIPVVPADPPATRGRRSRHSRDETGAIPVPTDAAPAEAPRPAPTNGHHHGPEASDDASDLATGPMAQVGTPEPTPAPASPGPDTFDSQLSERERELLARLHEELASRERLEADAPDPLLGRPGQQQPPPAPPGSEDTTAPRPRPVGPPPGPTRPPSPYPGPPSQNGTGTNGHHPGVNGHGLPRRGDHDGEDGTSRDR
jgi:hypothetical protein